MKKYVFYKGLNECVFTVCQGFIDRKTSFFLKVLVSHIFVQNLLFLSFTSSRKLVIVGVAYFEKYFSGFYENIHFLCAILCSYCGDFEI